MVKEVCEAISASWKTMSYLQFSEVRGLAEETVCLIQLSSGVIVNKLSLVNNNLEDRNIKTFVKQWRDDKPKLREVTVEAGNPLLTDVGIERLRKFIAGQPDSDDTSSSEDESTSKIMSSRNSSPLVSKPPPHPRKGSFQSSVSARSDKTGSDKAESENSDSDKAESDKAESVKAESNKDEPVKENSGKVDSDNEKSDKAKTDTNSSEISRDESDSDESDIPESLESYPRQDVSDGNESDKEKAESDKEKAESDRERLEKATTSQSDESKKSKWDNYPDSYPCVSFCLSMEAG